MYEIRSGKLRHYVEFFRFDGSQDENGEPNGLTLVHDSRADIQVKSGSQNAEYGTVVTSTVITALMYYSDQVQHKDKMKWNGTEYEVDHINTSPDLRAMIVTGKVTRG